MPGRRPAGKPCAGPGPASRDRWSRRRRVGVSAALRGPERTDSERHFCIRAADPTAGGNRRAGIAAPAAAAAAAAAVAAPPLLAPLAPGSRPEGRSGRRGSRSRPKPPPPPPPPRGAGLAHGHVTARLHQAGPAPAGPYCGHRPRRPHSTPRQPCLVVSSILVLSSQSPSGPAGGAPDGYGLGRGAAGPDGHTSLPHVAAPSRCPRRDHPYVRSCSASGTE